MMYSNIGLSFRETVSLRLIQLYHSFANLICWDYLIKVECLILTPHLNINILIFSRETLFYMVQMKSQYVKFGKYAFLIKGRVSRIPWFMLRRDWKLQLLVAGQFWEQFTGGGGPELTFWDFIQMLAVEIKFNIDIVQLQTLTLFRA